MVDVGEESVNLIPATDFPDDFNDKISKLSGQIVKSIGENEDSQDPDVTLNALIGVVLFVMKRIARNEAEFTTNTQAVASSILVNAKQLMQKDPYDAPT